MDHDLRATARRSILVCGVYEVITSDELKDIILSHRPVFTAPPESTPADHSVDGPLLGNGDFAATISGPSWLQRYSLAKNDFWKLRKGLRFGGGAAPIGGVDIRIPDLFGVGTYHIEQNLYYAETLGVFTSPDRRISIKSWISATRNTLFIEIENIGLPTVMEPELWIQSGRGSTSECIQKKRLAWARRAFTANCQINTGAAITMCMPEHPQKDTSEDLSSVFLKNGDRAIIAISATSISRPLFRKSTENGGKTSGANRRFT